MGSHLAVQGSPAMLESSLAHAALLYLVCLRLQLYKDWQDDEETAKKDISSMVFNTFIFCQVRGRRCWLCGCGRQGEDPTCWRCRPFWAGWAAACCCHDS